MYEDEYGYEYPKIDSSLCVECGLCKKVCSYQSQNIKKEVKKVYAAAAKDNNLIMKSASGGVLGELAKAIIEKGGVVYGAAMLVEDNMLVPKQN